MQNIKQAKELYEKAYPNLTIDLILEVIRLGVEVKLSSIYFSYNNPNKKDEITKEIIEDLKSRDFEIKYDEDSFTIKVSGWGVNE